MIQTHRLKNLIMTSIIISYVAVLLNQLGILQYPFGATYGTNSPIVLNVGSIIGLVFAIIAIRLVLIVPEK
jgi:hypothetical protein